MKSALRLAIQAAFAAAAAGALLSCGDGTNGPADDDLPDPGRVSTLAAGLDLPVGLAVAANGRVFVAERYGDRISTITRAGITTLARGIDAPLGVVLGPGDTVFVTTERGRLYTIAPEGDTASVAVTDSALAGVVRDIDGRLFACDVFGGRVLEIARDGSASAVATDLTYPSGLLSRPEGTLLVSSALAGTVQRFIPGEGVMPYVLVSAPPVTALDIRWRTGYLYIADNAAGAVWRTPDGTSFERYVDRLGAPVGLAFFGDTLYVSSADRNVVYRVLPPAGAR